MKELPYGALKQVSHDTNIKYQTLKKWRQKFKKDPNYTPYEALGVTTLPNETEDQLFNLVSDKLNNGTPFTLNELQDTAIHLYQQLSMEQVGRDRFSATNSWAYRFLDKYGLSVRSSKPSKKGEVDPKFIDIFIEKLTHAAQDYHPERIFNMDETFVHVCCPPSKVIGRKGAENVPSFINEDEKSGFTCLTTISFGGTILEPIFLTKGNQENSEMQFGEAWNYENDIKIMKSETGWATSEVMCQYIKWLSEQVNNEPCCLVLDVYSTHKDAIVRELAQSLQIDLIFVPANGTGSFQPLDRKIFGIIKAKMKKAWDISRRKAIEGNSVWNKALAARTFKEILNKVSSHAYKSAWNIPGFPMISKCENKISSTDDTDDTDYNFEDEFLEYF